MGHRHFIDPFLFIPPLGEHLAGVALAFLHVGLVKGVDVEEGAGGRDRELPAVELAS